MFDLTLAMLLHYPRKHYPKKLRFCMLSSSEMCEWLWKQPVRSRRKSAEVYCKCSKWWP